MLMGMFGGARALGRTGVQPYFPTPEEQATATPGFAGPAQGRSSRGIFGAPMLVDQPAPSGMPSLGLGQAAGLGGQAPNAANDMSAAGISGDLGPMSPDYASLTKPVDMSNVQTRKPGFFQHGGLGEKILSGIGEVGLRYSASQGDPFALMTLRNRFDQQQAGVRAKEEARRRLQERDEWTWREQWKQAHPDDQFTQYMQAAGIDPRSSQGQALYRQRAESMAAPPLMAVDGFDAQGNQTKTFMPRAGLGGGGMNPQAAPAGPAIGTVKNGYKYAGGNPNDRNSWVPVGGASPSGGATFR